jgi:hypothetical protein
MVKILKIKSKRTPHKFIAISVKDYIKDYLSLYCLAKGVTKSDIIKGFLNTWYNDTRLRETDEMLIEETINDRIYRYKSDDKFASLSFEEYKEMVEIELIQSGIKMNYVTNILNRLINE